MITSTSDFGFAAEFAALERKVARMGFTRFAMYQAVERSKKHCWKTHTYTKFEITDGFGDRHIVRTAPMSLWAASQSLNMPYSAQIRGLA